MKCQNCGNEITDNQKFCSNCGKAINKEKIIIENSNSANNSKPNIKSIVGIFIIIIFVIIFGIYLLNRQEVINLSNINFKQDNSSDNKFFEMTFEDAQTYFKDNGYIISDTAIAQNGKDVFYAFLLYKDETKYLSSNINVNTIVATEKSPNVSVDKTGFGKVKMEDNRFYIEYIEQGMRWTGRNYVKAYMLNKVYSDGTVIADGVRDGNPL